MGITYRKIIALLILFSIILFSSCGLLPEEDEKLSPPIKVKKEVQYKTFEVVRKDLDKSINFFAVWKSTQNVRYSFNDYVAPFLEYRISKGDSIEPGDVLAVLDIGDIDNKIRDANIAYQKQKLSHDRILENYKMGKNSLYEVKIAELDLQYAENKLNDLKKRKKGSLLVSDVFGVVIRTLDIKEGEEVDLGTDIITVVKSDELKLEGNSSRIRVEGIKEGHEVVIQDLDEKISGTIKKVRGGLVEIEPEFMKEDWKLSKTLRITVPVESVKNAIVIDVAAIRTIGSTNFVRVLKDGVAVEKEVEIGISAGRYIEIKEGLEPGELVIIN